MPKKSKKKKSTKKKSTKKTQSKKKSSKKSSKKTKKSTKKTSKKVKRPVTAKTDHYFVLASGVHLKSLKELADALEHMNEHVFRHHVNQHRNDFAAWTGLILKEEELAEEMRDIHDKHEMEVAILRHLVTKYL